MANGRLYGLDRWHPGRICGQILLLQAAFYAVLAASTALGCWVLGAEWLVMMMFATEYYSGACVRGAGVQCDARRQTVLS